MGLVKITRNGIVLSLAAIVFMFGLAAIALRSVEQPTYDEQSHRAEITKIYPSVHWPEYREAARDVCGLSEHAFQLVAAMAKDDGPKAAQAMAVSTAYMCPERLKWLEK